MSSQEDIFATQPPLTQPPLKPKIGYVVLFDLTGRAIKPFGIYPRLMFTTHEIKDRWLDSILDTSSRMTPLVLDRLPEDKSFSLFSKVRQGKSRIHPTEYLEF